MAEFPVIHAFHKRAYQGVPLSGSARGCCTEQDPEKTSHHLSPADDIHGSHGRHVCRRHELYVSFQDLGWLVIPTLPRPPVSLNDNLPLKIVSVSAASWGISFCCVLFSSGFSTFSKRENVLLLKKYIVSGT